MIETVIVLPNLSANNQGNQDTDDGAVSKVTPEQIDELSYCLALEIVAIIDDDLWRKTRHYRTKAGLLLTEQDQVIQAALDNNLLITVPGDQVFYVPPTFALCPYCDARLYAGFTAWAQEDDGTWTGEEVELECESEPDIEQDEEAWDEWLRQHSEMPYVYWLPVTEKVKQWINSQYRFAKGEFEP